MALCHCSLKWAQQNLISIHSPAAVDLKVCANSTGTVIQKREDEMCVRCEVWHRIRSGKVTKLGSKAPAPNGQLGFTRPSCLCSSEKALLKIHCTDFYFFPPAASHTVGSSPGEGGGRPENLTKSRGRVTPETLRG